MTVIRLTPAQYDYLSSAEFLRTELRQAVVEGSSKSGDGTATVVLEDNDRERLRDALTERLAQVGFDAEYRPTGEGRLLENLIDSSF